MPTVHKGHFINLVITMVMLPVAKNDKIIEVSK